MLSEDQINDTEERAMAALGEKISKKYVNGRYQIVEAVQVKDLIEIAKTGGLGCPWWCNPHLSRSAAKIRVYDDFIEGINGDEYSELRRAMADDWLVYSRKTTNDWGLSAYSDQDFHILFRPATPEDLKEEKAKQMNSRIENFKDRLLHIEETGVPEYRKPDVADDTFLSITVNSSLAELNKVIGKLTDALIPLFPEDSTNESFQNISTKVQSSLSSLKSIKAYIEQISKSFGVPAKEFPTAPGWMKAYNKCKES